MLRIENRYVTYLGDKVMTFKLACAAVIAFAGLTSAALAGSWDDEKNLCAEAIASKAGVDASAYTATLSKARDGASKRLTVELKAEGAATLVGECKIKRGEVTEVALKA